MLSLAEQDTLGHRRERFFMTRKMMQFHVRPRYTAGSPALVHGDIARKVAAEEKDAIEHALSGAWGEDEKKRAETLGLSGIAYVMFENGAGRKFRWHVWDLITDEETRRLHQNEIYRLGYTRFEHLPQTIQKRLVQPGCRYSDSDREFYKVDELGTLTQYKPEIVRGL
jgi:hypothetical protein